MRSFFTQVFLVSAIFFVVKSDETSCKISMLKQPPKEGSETQTLFDVTLECNQVARTLVCDSSKDPQFKAYIFKKEAKKPEGPQNLEEEVPKEKKKEEQVDVGIQTVIEGEVPGQKEIKKLDG